jgi:hypothetical protein
VVIAAASAVIHLGYRRAKPHAALEAPAPRPAAPAQTTHLTDSTPVAPLPAAASPRPAEARTPESRAAPSEKERRSRSTRRGRANHTPELDADGIIHL